MRDTVSTAGEFGPNWRQAALLGLALALGQTALVCLLSGAANPAEAYLRLHRWDAVWYGHIAEHGYRSTVPPTPQDADRSNVAFFPGYPLLARAVAAASGLRIEYALPLTSQLACWGFWTYLLRILQSWRVSARLAFGTVVIILSHPAAFFLVVGYSESLFLMTLLGYLYWSGERGGMAWSLAACHGFLMTATRIVGLPLTAYPLLRLCRRPALGEGAFSRWLKGVLAGVLLCAVASLGTLLFLLYCQLEFGHWDLYMQSQRIGWKIHPDYLAVFRPASYRAGLPSGIAGTLNSNDLSRLSVPLVAAAFAALLAFEGWAAWGCRPTGFRDRVGFYLGGGLMFYISVSGMACVNMTSMLRYSFPVHVMLVLAAAHLLGRLGPAVNPLLARTRPVIVVAVGVCAWLQITYARGFAHGGWVA